MDLSKLTTADRLMVGGGIAMFVLGFLLPWSSITIGPISDSGDNPFHYFFTGGIAWLLVVMVGVLALLKALGKLQGSQPWNLIFVLASGLATLLMVLRVLLGGRSISDSFVDVTVDRGIGMFGAVIWAAVALAGAVMAFQSAGGDLKDLTDIDKMKDSFGGDTPPPPPY